MIRKTYAQSCSSTYRSSSVTRKAIQYINREDGHHESRRYGGPTKQLQVHERVVDKKTDIKDGKGGIDNLFIGDVPRPKPTSTQALVKVKAFGLNRMDLLQREGMYPVPPGASKILGVEFSGTIEELASESEKGFKKGDSVFGLAYGGAYAEYIAVSTHMLVHKPEELSWEECAGIPEVRSSQTTCASPY